MQRVVPTLVGQIAKIQICRDPLTATSRGVCYLAFDTLVDAMNTHNALKALDPPLSMEAKDGGSFLFALIIVVFTFFTS